MTTRKRGILQGALYHLNVRMIDILASECPDDRDAQGSYADLQPARLILIHAEAQAIREGPQMEIYYEGMTSPSD
jgi:hypothetical protein